MKKTARLTGRLQMAVLITVVRHCISQLCLFVFKAAILCQFLEPLDYSLAYGFIDQTAR